MAFLAVKVSLELTELTEANMIAIVARFTWLLPSVSRPQNPGLVWHLRSDC